MKKYSIKDDPVFNEEIMIPETGEPGHADVINAAPKQIFENTLANREELQKGDSKDRTVTFDSNDDNKKIKWTDIPVMESGEKHKSLFGKISTVVKNVRFLYNLLGSTDLSTIGDGSVTGILAALKPYCFVDPVDHLLANIKGKPLDATQGAVVQGEIDDLRDAVTQINSDLAASWKKPEANTSVVTSNEMQINIYARICIIYIYVRVNISENQKYFLLSEDIPKPTFGYEPKGIAIDTNTGRNFLILAGKTGLYIHSPSGTVPYNGTVWGSIIYVTNNS